MVALRTLLRSFGGGELSPELLGRPDDQRYATSVRGALNFLGNPRGPAVKRRGGQHVAGTKGNATMQLLPFKFSAEQQLVIGLGAGFTRLYALGREVLYAEIRQVASVDTALDTLVFATPHGFLPADQVRVFAFDGGGAVPAPLSSATTYTVVVVDAWTIQLSGQNLTTAGTGAILVVPAAQVPLNYRAPHTASTVAINSDVIDIGTAHGLTTGEPVSVTTTTTLPVPLIASNRYFAIAASASTLKLASTEANALAGVAIDLPGTACTLNGTTDRVELVGHPFSNDQKVSLGGTWLIGGLSQGVTYYVKNATANDFQISATLGGPAILWGAANTAATVTSADMRVHFYYENGDHIYLTGAGTGFYACIQTNPQDNAPPAFTDYWFRLPDSGVLEVPNDYTEDQLLRVDFSQSNDIVRLANLDKLLGSLTRLSATAWAFEHPQLLPPLSAPLDLAGTSVYGDVVYVTKLQPLSLGFNHLKNAVPVKHGLAVGDAVEIVGLSAYSIPDDTYIIGAFEGPAGQVDEFGLKRRSDGHPVDYATGVGAGGVTVDCSARVTSLGSDAENRYVVTALNDVRVEGQPCDPITLTNNLTVTGASNTLTWSAVPGASRYRVYREVNGLFGWIGETDALNFKDDYLPAKLDVTPPILDQTISGSKQNAVAHSEQRLCLGGFNTAPQRSVLSRTAAEEDFSVHIPVRDDDRISVDVPLDGSPIRHLVQGPNGLLVLTTGAELMLEAGSDLALAPETVRLRYLSRVGAAPAQPVVINDRAVFVAQRGHHVHAIGFDPRDQRAVDLCLRANHMFDGHQIVQLACLQSPYPVVFAVRDDGVLLALSFLPGEEVLGWSRLQFTGHVESVCGIQDGTEDALYLLVRRGATRSVQRMQLDVYLDACTVHDATHPGSAGTVQLTGGMAWGPSETLQLVTSGYEPISVGDVLEAYLDTEEADGSVTHTAVQVEVLTVVDGLNYTVHALREKVPLALRDVALAGWRHAVTELATPHLATTLTVRADGQEFEATTDANGLLSLDTAYFDLVAGLSFTADLSLLPLQLPQDSAGGKGLQWNINHVWASTVGGDYEVGPALDRLEHVPAPATGVDDQRVLLDGLWTPGGDLFLRSTSATPLTVRYLALDLVAVA